MKALLFACLVGLAASAFAASINIPEEMNNVCFFNGCTVVPNAVLQQLVQKAQTCSKGV